MSGAANAFTLTFSAPAPRTGMVVNISSDNAFVANNISSSAVPAGATQHRMTIRTGRVAVDTRVTFTAKVAHVGPALSSVLTVGR